MEQWALQHNLLWPARVWIYVIGFGLASLLLQVFVPYTTYVKYLKWLTLALFAYLAAAFFVRIQWHQALYASLFPKLIWSKSYLTAIIAVFGTTISPYLFFWQASQEVEEVKRNDGEEALKKAPRQARDQLRRIRLDNAHGETDIDSAAQAAKALAPLAGPWAAWLFASGIIGTGMLAVPVLAGSAAYALGEACKWPVSLERKPQRAIGFYVTIAAWLRWLVSVLISYTSIPSERFIGRRF